MKLYTFLAATAALSMSPLGLSQHGNPFVVPAAPQSKQTPPPIATLTFEPLVIRNVEVRSGKPYPIDEHALRAKLSKQYDEWVVRSVSRRHLAVTVEPVSGGSPNADAYLLRTVMKIPLTHRADFTHWDNEFRRGKFMGYTMTLLGPTGKVVAKTHGPLVWGDGDWTRGGGRGRTVAAHDDIMMGYVRKTIDRGVAELKHGLVATRN